MTGDCVLDASVGIKLSLVEELSGQADRLFDQLAGYRPARFYVPDLFYLECANILWKYVSRFGYPPENARQDVTDLRSLALVTVSAADLLEPLSYAFGSQSPIPGKIPPIGRVGCRLESSKNGRHLLIAGAAAAFVGHGQGGIDGDQPRPASRDRRHGKVQNLVVVSQAPGGAYNFPVLRQHDTPGPVAG